MIFVIRQSNILKTLVLIRLLMVNRSIEYKSVLRDRSFFYEGGGASGIWGWVTKKKLALKGGPSKKK